MNYNNEYKGGDNMKKYILNLTKEELDIIKHSLSIAQLELNSRGRNSANFGNARASIAYYEEEIKVEELLKELSKLKGED